MKKFALGLFAGVGTLMAFTALGQAQSKVAAPGTEPIDGQAPAQCPSPATMEANKRVVEAFFAPGVTTDQRIAMMDPSYRQHNPSFKRFDEINGFNGPQGYKGLTTLSGRNGPFDAAKTDGPQPPPDNPLYKVMADCDMVFIIQQHFAPDPMRKGQFYEVFWFDAWRMRNGKMVEHWDQGTIPNPPPPHLTTPLKDLKPAPAAR